MSALKYWIWLSSLRQVGPVAVFSLIDAYGTPENVYFAGNAELQAFLGRQTGRPSEGLFSRNLDTAERILEQCDILSLRVMTMQDADYPERLKNIHAPPSVLYIKGRLPTMDEEAALAIVGARKATPYGIQAAGRLSFSLAGSGMLIVSGLAAGIDAAAHAAALRAGAPTVAVLGCGADVPYPASNRSLYEDVSSAGALVSEYPPGTRPLGGHFPMRNRIISGLTLGTMVVEAGEKSGALITAHHALEQGRDVFAVPGNIDAPGSVGTNRLLKEGAQMVTEPQDVLREYVALYPHRITQPQTPSMPPPALSGNPMPDVSESNAPDAPTPGMPTPGTTAPWVPMSGITGSIEDNRDLSPEGKTIIEALADKDCHVDELVGRVGLPAFRVLRELTLLELNDAVHALPGNRYRAAGRVLGAMNK
ncbi:MAG: DNA-processing protein DprA [Oscillospiraceae bacterium]|nr:DNA-processing protein DprA [Oscillospiraceae bacterium]